MAFKQLIKEGNDTNKHYPIIEVNNNIVTVKCGKAGYHVSTPEHYIGWIKLYGQTDKALLEIGSVTFWPGLAEPLAQFNIIDKSKFTKLVAASYCNLHGIFEAEVAL